MVTGVFLMYSIWGNFLDREYQVEGELLHHEERPSCRSLPGVLCGSELKYLSRDPKWSFK